MANDRYSRWSTEGILTVGTAEWWAKQLEISRTMAGALEDARNGISRSASMIKPQREETPRAPSGGTVPISPPSGVEWCDRLVDAQDERDRIARLREARENRWIEQQLARDTNKVRSEYDVLKRFDNETPSFHREKK